MRLKIGGDGNQIYNNWYFPFEWGYGVGPRLSSSKTRVYVILTVAKI